MNRSFTAVERAGSSRQGGSGVGVTRGSPGGPRRRSSVEVPMGSHGQGSIRAASRTTLGVLGTSKMKENERFYGFTDYRGPAAQRGRDSRGSANQVTAGKLSVRLLHRLLPSYLQRPSTASELPDQPRAWLAPPSTYLSPRGTRRVTGGTVGPNSRPSGRLLPTVI